MASTTAVAEPLTTLVPMKSSTSRSKALRPSGSCSSANFSTGSDSPVIAAWLTNRSLACSTRQSAGIMSPADRRTTSPGTRSRMGSSVRLAWAAVPGAAPVVAGRSTPAVLATMSLSRSAARPERASCTKRSPVDSSTIAPMTPAARSSDPSQDTAASSVSSRLNGLR